MRVGGSPRGPRALPFAAMLILPAIDLLGGQAVRLRQGRYDEVTIYESDPGALAARWRGVVARLHVVDLDGARAGRPVQVDALRAIVRAFGPDVEVGGGVRSLEAVETYLALGCERVVLGTAAVRDPALVRSIAARHPERVVVAVDAKDGFVATEGWEKVSARTAIDVARELADAPLAALLYTDIARDGTQVGPNVAATAALAESTAHPVLASGGIGTLEHLRQLARIPNVVGAIIGRALYERAFALEDAIASAAR
jgi:phosphoribosylformimino-5-aminoimidazole carboxamide ribotide isomerase